MDLLARSHAAPALAIVFALASCPALAQEAKFDGTWNVVMTCPPHDDADDDAKGYTHRFQAEVSKGRIQGTHGKEGEPGWHFLHGRIDKSGSAALRLDGIVNNPKYAINHAQRGKEYSYRIKAQFDEGSGVGQRLTGRACEFRFTR
ncbi:MAG: hypothetical protein ABI520_04625 [Caldimonas sp.]